MHLTLFNLKQKCHNPFTNRCSDKNNWDRTHLLIFLQLHSAANETSRPESLKTQFELLFSFLLLDTLCECYTSLYFLQRLNISNLHEHLWNVEMYFCFFQNVNACSWYCRFLEQGILKLSSIPDWTCQRRTREKEREEGVCAQGPTNLTSTFVRLFWNDLFLQQMGTCAKREERQHVCSVQTLDRIAQWPESERRMKSANPEPMALPLELHQKLEQCVSSIYKELNDWMNSQVFNICIYTKCLLNAAIWY